MAGIRVGGIAVVQLLPDIPILAFRPSPNFQRTLYKIGNTATPLMFTEPIVTSLGTPQIHLGDPMREPLTGDSVVYSRFQTTGTITRTVRLVDWEDTTDVELYADATGGVSGSCQPMWKPDGSQILFRAGTSFEIIKVMDPDGSNVQTLYTGVGEVRQPTYNIGLGDKIAWMEGNDIHVMDDDGSNESVIHTVTNTPGAFLSWLWDDISVVFQDNDASDDTWQRIEQDGTNLATWLTVSRAGYGPGQQNPALIMWSWTSNDEILTTVRAPADPDPDAKLGLIDSGGLTYVSPARYAAADSGADDLRPVALTGFAEGVERFWWLEQSSDDLVASVLPDGSDYRVDFDGSVLSGNPTFHGFRGDTTN